MPYIFHTFSFRAGRLLLPLMAILLLAGCKSSRKIVKGSEGTAVTPAVSVSEYIRRADDPMARALIAEAQTWLGTRYVYGGESKDGTDCSGLVMTIYEDVCGIKLPRTTRDQVRYCTKVARNRLQPGDLVFFGADDSSVSHVGLFIGDGRMIHASSSRGVMVSGFDTGYWGARYFTGARVDSASDAYAHRSGSRKATASPVYPAVPAGAPSISLAAFTASGRSVPAEEAPSSEPPTSSSTEVPAAPSDVPVDSSAPASAGAIDLLDQIINQTVDSIFTSQFSD